MTNCEGRLEKISLQPSKKNEVTSLKNWSGRKVNARRIWTRGLSFTLSVFCGFMGRYHLLERKMTHPFETYARAVRSAGFLRYEGGWRFVFYATVPEQRREKISAWLRANREQYLDWLLPVPPDWTDEEYAQIQLESSELESAIAEIFRCHEVSKWLSTGKNT